LKLRFIIYKPDLLEESQMATATLKGNPVADNAGGGRARREQQGAALRAGAEIANEPNYHAALAALT